MNCDFCYIPFDNNNVDNPELWLKIIDRCKQWNPEVITFGGGDPFAYEKFPVFLKTLEKENLFLQVDTNGLHLKECHLHLIKKSIDLVSLPLDGQQEIHTNMRKNPSHFNIVIDLIQKLSDVGIKVKVNTVVTKMNILHLENLAILLSTLPISAWSLYQFWPIGPSKKFKKQFEVSNQEFHNAVSTIKSKYTFTNIESSSFDDRHLSYFFVTSNGRVYTINKSNPEEYVEVGNVFDEDIIQKWKLHGNVENVAHRAKLRINI